jgi:phosphoglycolate phosphatase
MDRILQRMLDIYEAEVAERTRFFAGMETVLDALDARGLPWGIVTNKISRFTDPLARVLKLWERSGCIISGDTTAEKKPHPLPLFEACRRLNLAAERCVYVGDAARDVEAGRRAGMATLAALYGYIAADDEPSGWGADGLLAEPLELLAWLDSEGHP